MLKLIRPVALPQSLITEQLARLNALPNTVPWRLHQLNDAEQRLVVSYRFRNFATTWHFLHSILHPIHTLKHHPTIKTTYNQVEIELTTHDLGNRISIADFRVALVIAEKYRQLQTVPPATLPNHMSISEASDLINDIIQPRIVSSKEGC